ncbi:hypothetical protein J6590_062759 [Homalodisca vitripennis]|nr:hypothetical protein J6590_062759 [Homalodisca vitripennis]
MTRPLQLSFPSYILGRTSEITPALVENMTKPVTNNHVHFYIYILITTNNHLHFNICILITTNNHLHFNIYILITTTKTHQETKEEDLLKVKRKYMVPEVAFVAMGLNLRLDPRRC